MPPLGGLKEVEVRALLSDDRVPGVVHRHLDDNVTFERYQGESLLWYRVAEEADDRLALVLQQTGGRLPSTPYGRATEFAIAASQNRNAGGVPPGASPSGLCGRYPLHSSLLFAQQRDGADRGIGEQVGHRSRTESTPARQLVGIHGGGGIDELRNGAYPADRSCAQTAYCRPISAVSQLWFTSMHNRDRRVTYEDDVGTGSQAKESPPQSAEVPDGVRARAGSATKS